MVVIMIIRKIKFKRIVPLLAFRITDRDGLLFGSSHYLFGCFFVFMCLSRIYRPAVYIWNKVFSFTLFETA